jgi:hypothetical protein
MAGTSLAPDRAGGEDGSSFASIRVNLIRAAVGVARGLLPFRVGGGLPLTPRLPDFQAVLSNVASLVQNVLGMPPSEPPAAVGEEGGEDGTQSDPAPGETPEESPLPAIEDAIPSGATALSEGGRAPLPVRPGLVPPELSPSLLSLSDPVPAASVLGGVEGAPVALSGSAGRGEVVDRMLGAARLTQLHGAARLKIALHPPHLGELKVELTLRHRLLHGTLQAENAEAKDVLAAHLAELRESLEKQGLRIGDLQVEVSPSSGQPRREGEQASFREPAGVRRDGEESPAMAAGELVRSARVQVFDVEA